MSFYFGEAWGKHWEYPEKIRVQLRPHTAGSELLELIVLSEPSKEKLANIIFASLQLRILSSKSRRRNANFELRCGRCWTIIEHKL